jgi:hypothetical protein
MLKKLLLGLFVGMMTLGFAYAEEKPVYYVNKDAIGYQDATNGLNFSPSFTDMISKIGKVDAFEIAINKTKNPDAVLLNNNLNYKASRINLTEIDENNFLRIGNIALSSVGDVSFLRIYTNVPFSTQTIQTENYKVSYTVGNGYLYKIVLETKYQESKYKENFDREQQKEYLTARTYNYLNNNGYKSLSTWYKQNNQFIKDDMLIDMDTPEVVDNNNLSTPSQYFSVSVTNERLMQEYKRGKRTAYNTEVNKTFRDFDRVMK